jgi:hypothetical protein
MADQIDVTGPRDAGHLECRSAGRSSPYLDDGSMRSSRFFFSGIDDGDWAVAGAAPSDEFIVNGRQDR